MRYKINSQLRYFFLIITWFCSLFFSNPTFADEKKSNLEVDIYSNQINPPDPLEVVNRPIFSFNLWLDDNLLAPVSRGYKEITPKPVDESITNFFSNLGNITTGANLLLQGEFKKSGETAGRFLANTVFGIFGLFDIATEQGVAQHKSGFNDTLKTWGVESGPYIVLPIFGPNTPRTIAGRVGDFYTDPIQGLDYQSFLRVLGFVDYRADNNNLFEMAKSASFDPYESLKLYFLKKENQEQKVIDDLDDFEPL